MQERKKTLFANLEEQLKAFDELIKTRLAEERDALAESDSTDTLPVARIQN